ncbi:interleukin-7 receptor subunit alpha isoform X2 [Conger conger]|uniref:interleukin-7 receptor subunit alpha isoform X2 n=1 Tax=Conger conger TaxID=82655 RepID=UPI002A59A134|nr:interleukin-7 receptor subunit alpha isoform X2 [Conger conger]
MCYWPWALLLPLVAQAQSGRDGVSSKPWEQDPGVDCSSNINVRQPSTLTCQLDIDDPEEVAEISLCKSSPKTNETCERKELKKNTVTFHDLDIMTNYELRIQFETGESFRNEYDLKSIIKPSSPWIINATYLQKSGMVPVHIGTQYQHTNYLTGKLIFELEITSAQNTMQSKPVPYTPVIIERSHLRHNTKYSVRVRARPDGDFFKGTWSEWSPSVSFQTPTLQDPDASLLVYGLIAALVILLLIFAIAILRWHKIIRSYIWPRIPNPKNTLLQMYKPNKTLPKSFNPEAFCDQIIHRVVHIEAQGVELEAPREVRGWKREGLTVWNTGNLEGLHLLPKPGAEETDGGGAQTAGLLDGSGDVRGGSWPQTPALPATGRRDGAYITMSSIFNTQ